jgi:hypothetical protein
MRGVTGVAQQLSLLPFRGEGWEGGSPKPSWGPGVPLATLPLSPALSTEGERGI